MNNDPNCLGNVEKGILHIQDSLYPESLKEILGKHAPQELCFLGNLSLLDKVGVGFCGSRNASDKGIDTAADCAEQVASNWLVVISGNAIGVDMAAHYAALKAGGSTILVIPEGINHFRVKKDLREVWDWSRVLVVSQFKPDAVWQTYHAMGRNQVIVALSKAMIVIEAQEKGGTMEAGKSTLKLKMPLFVATYEDMPTQSPGSSLLLGMGALSLKKSQSMGRAKLASLFNVVNNPGYHAPISSQQLNLL